MTPTQAVEQLDAMTGKDPERDHAEADDILIAMVPLEVREAYVRLIFRSGFWAFA